MARKPKEQEPEVEEQVPLIEEKSYGPNGLPFLAIEEGRANLNYIEIKANMAHPIDKRFISQKPVRSRGKQVGHIDYVNVTDLKDMLDERAGLWTAAVKNTIVMGNQLGVVVSLTVHCLDGDWTQDGTGHESLNYSGFGDTYSNAYAQAFRRACEGHGLGRELWRKDEITTTELDIIDGEQEQTYNNNETPRRPQPVQNNYQSQSNFSGPAQPSQVAPPSTTPMSDKQKSYIENLCTEKGQNPDLVSLELFKEEFEKITKVQASKMIEYISGSSR